jgi:hypothetical protein
MCNVIQYFAQVSAIALLTYLYIPIHMEVNSDDD